MDNIKKKQRLIKFLKGISVKMYVLLSLSILCLASYITARLWEDFAEFFARYISAAVRYALAALTSFIPFSLGESLMLLLFPAVITGIIFAFIYAKNKEAERMTKLLKSIFCVILICFDLFVLTIGTCYYRKSLDENLGLEKAQGFISTQELASTLEKLVALTNKQSELIYYKANDSSIMPCSLDETLTLVNQAFDSLAQKHPFLQAKGFKPKIIALSVPMTYLHTSGVYTCFTGEANINSNFPDYIIAYTAAHELAHARGIAKENDANFVAFLVCLESEDPYIKYSGLVNIITDVANALYSADNELYNEIMKKLTINVYGEYAAFNSFFEKYEDNTAHSISSGINDIYLKINGQKDGIQSYSQTVDLTVAYFRELDINTVH